MFVFWKVRRAKQQIIEWFTAPDDKTLSPFAQLTDVVSQVMARSIVAQFKTTFMGIQSGLARGSKAVEGALAQDMLAQESPLAGSLLASFPALSKALRKNPALGALAQIALQRFVNNNHHSTPAASISEMQSKFGGFGGK